MQISFGKHCGRSVEFLVLTEPDYLLWMLRQKAPTKAMQRVLEEASRLIGVFDRKPLQRQCSGWGCSNPATRFSAYTGSPHLEVWCENCRPSSGGADTKKLRVIRRYDEALEHVCATCSARSGGLQSIIADLAHAKGLPYRAREKDRETFFRK